MSLVYSLTKTYKLFDLITINTNASCAH